MFLLKFLLIAFLFSYIGYRIGLASSGFSIDNDDLSDCCGSSVVEKKQVSCLNCGKFCKTKKR